MRKCNTVFNGKRFGSRRDRTIQLTHESVNDKEWQLYANALLYKLLVRAGV